MSNFSPVAPPMGGGGAQGARAPTETPSEFFTDHKTCPLQLPGKRRIQPWLKQQQPTKIR